MLEFPMFSPFPLGVHYTKFTHKNDLTLSDGKKIVSELNSYKAYDNFKWTFFDDGTPQQGEYQPLPGLIINEGAATIKTNSINKFSPKDIVLIKCPYFPKGKLFIISEVLNPEFTYTPKPRLRFQILELKELL